MLPAITIFQERFGPIRYFMAPMAGISDMVFRTLIRQMGAQAVVSELLSAEGLVRGGAKTRELMRFSEEERPVGIQLFGHEPARLVEAARIVESEGADFVDLNLGCPVKKVVCDGAGAAWLKEPQKLGELLTLMKSNLRIPLTIKIRTGWDSESVTVNEVVRVAAHAGCAWVAIHGRTRAQGYSGTADWELIRSVARQSPIPIIGNGDLIRAEDAIQKISDGYSNAVMIGRGALKNPWIFQEILGIASDEKNFLGLIERHFLLAESMKGEARAYLSLKKFMGWYAAGYRCSSQFRSRIFQTRDLSELKALCFDYFSTLSMSDRVADTQPFLMGGHG